MAVPLLLAARTLATGAGRGALLKGAAKKVAKEKLLGGKSDKDVKKLPPATEDDERSSSIVRRESSGLVPYKPKVEFKKISTDKLIPSGSGEKRRGKVKNLLRAIDQNLQSLKKYFEKKKKADAENFTNTKKEAEVDKKKKREKELEKEKGEKSKTRLPSLPGMSFLDSIMNFFGNILIGSLLMLLLRNKDIILKALNDITKGLTNTWDLLRYSIITISKTAQGLIKKVAKLGAKLFNNRTSKNLLKKLGGGIKNLFQKLGQSIVRKIGSLVQATGSAAGQGAASIARRGLGRVAQRGAAAVGGKAAAKGVKLFGSKGAKYLGRLSNVFKKIPVIGALIGIGIDLALGERLDNAVAGAAGASLGGSIGAAIGTGVLPIPYVGTFLGGVVGAAVGDWVGKEIWKNISGQVGEIKPTVEEGGEVDAGILPDPIRSKESGPGIITKLGSGGGSLKNMSDQDWSDLAYIVSGEAARGTDDEYGVAAAVLNRVSDPKWPSTIMGVGTQPGQFEAVYKGLARRDPALANKLKQNQGKIVEALKVLNGRTDFKGQSQLSNRGSGDPMFHPRGNFYHYSSQRAKLDPAPPNPPQDWKKFINGGNWKQSSTQQSIQPAAQISQSSSSPVIETHRSESAATISPQQTPIPQQRLNGLNQQTAYEQNKKVVAIMMGGGQQTPMIIPSGGGADSMFIPIGPSKQTALNNYYKSQLMGFLYKQG